MSIFAWGTSDDGAIGSAMDRSGSGPKKTTHEELLPYRMEKLREYEMQDIIAGDSHSLAIDSHGILHAW
jgi:alpha-tubulin suppressor-like RCC1 family protein